MALRVRHAFVSAKPDGVDATKVQATNWNADLTATMATARMLGRTTAGEGAVEELDAAAVLAFAGAEAAGVAAAGDAAHVAAGDPHGQYQLESEKDAANGYPGLDVNSRLVLARLPLADTNGKVLVRRACCRASSSTVAASG